MGLPRLSATSGRNVVGKRIWSNVAGDPLDHAAIIMQMVGRFVAAESRGMEIRCERGRRGRRNDRQGSRHFNTPPQRERKRESK